MDAARRRRTREADPARSALRRSVLAEAAVAVALLAVTTVLTTTETGRTQEQAERAGHGTGTTVQHAPPVAFQLPYTTGGGAHGQGSVMLDLTPSRPGSNDLQIMVMDPAGRAVDIPEVTVRLSLAAQRLGPLHVPLKHVAVGIWTSKGVQIPMAGDWRFDLTVRTSDIDEVTVHKNARIG
jgi:copper transport protein